MQQQNNQQQKAIMDADAKIKAKALEKDSRIPTKGFKDYWEDIKFYYLPIIIVVIFFLILILGVYPALSLLLNNIEELGTIRDEVDKKDEKIIVLKDLQSKSGVTNKYLDSINKIAPVDQTNVADFQTSIKNVATQNKLTLIDATSGEEIIANEESNMNFLQLIEVPTQFELEGTFTNLRKFLIDIYNGEDFIIIQEMEFRKAEGATNWKMDVTFAKYQFIESEATQTDQYNEYTKISEVSRPDKSVLEFLDDKYIDSEE